MAWLWVLIVAVVVIGVIVVTAVLRYMGVRGAVVTGGWIALAIDAYEKGSALHGAMSAAAAPGALAAEDSGARWSDIQRRADNLASALRVMRDSAVDPEDRGRAADALGSLQAARSAMEAYAGGGDAEAVRGPLAEFEKSLRALRSPEPHLW